MRGALGGTLLHDAARAWNARFAALLLDLGADVNACGQFGHTPLYHAANRYVEPRLRLPDDGLELVALLIRHGADLNGLGPVPGIAGRSPSYLVRQMFDMQAGARHGEWTELMKPVVAKLTNDDLVNIAAYVSSLSVASR